MAPHAYLEEKHQRLDGRGECSDMDDLEQRVQVLVIHL
jgi:hypothetical protein